MPGFATVTQAAVEAELHCAKNNGLVRELPIPGRDGMGWMLPPPPRPQPVPAATQSPRLADKLYRWHQNALRAWEQHHHRGIVEAVTGSGKTIVALAAWQRLQAEHKRLNTLVVVPTIELMNQWHGRVGTELPGRTIARVGGGHPAPRLRTSSPSPADCSMRWV